MWVVISASIFHKKTKDRRFISDVHMNRYKRLYRLFKAFDANDDALIEVPKAGDWADIFNRTYHVLYDECLYYEALKALLYLFRNGLEKTNDRIIAKNIRKRIRWITKRKARIKKKINDVFWFTKDNIEKIMHEYMIIEPIEDIHHDYYQSHLMPFKIHWHKRFDSFGNIMAILTGIANKRRRILIIDHILHSKVNKPFPIMSLSPPVFKNERGWEPIYRLKEQPYTNHNGGIWPVIAGFWICAIKHRKKLCRDELGTFADYLDKYGYKFNEYHHGKNGRPLGRQLTAWSAAGYIIAYHASKNNYKMFT
jgi:glycogen debranching enzyme